MKFIETKKRTEINILIYNFVDEFFSKNYYNINNDKLYNKFRNSYINAKVKFNIDLISPILIELLNLNKIEF